MSQPESLNLFFEALGMTTTAFRGYVRQRFKEADIDLTTEMMQVMRLLWINDNVNQQEIANAVGRDKATLTSMIDNLVRRQLVERRADQQDRRNKRIVLTAQGRALEQRVEPVIQEMFTMAGQSLQEPQLQTCIQALRQVSENLKPTLP